MLFLFCLFEAVAFSEYSVPSLPFSLSMESTSYDFFLLGGVFLPCDYGLDFYRIFSITQCCNRLYRAISIRNLGLVYDYWRVYTVGVGLDSP